MLNKRIPLSHEPLTTFSPQLPFKPNPSYAPYHASTHLKNKRNHFDTQSGNYWNKFYIQHGSKFFKDRHWILHEFESISHDGVHCEVGCGVGNTIWPLLAKNPNLKAVAFDIAPHAVELLNNDAKSRGFQDRVYAFPYDITIEMSSLSHAAPFSLPFSNVDRMSCFFVFSAIPPQNMLTAAKNCASFLKDGGLMFFRDYADGDLAQHQFKEKKAISFSPNDFIRGDGTRSYFFHRSELISLFASNNLHVLTSSIETKWVSNKKEAKTMKRQFVQAVFIKKNKVKANIEICAK